MKTWQSWFLWVTVAISYSIILVVIIDNAFKMLPLSNVILDTPKLPTPVLVKEDTAAKPTTVDTIPTLHANIHAHLLKLSPPLK